ncbi:MAG: DUF3099 domain-containing protein [Acidothermus cellulolyticus]|nr:DUF3099 domain-containing protein [Acidothermus cellulolyticus]
MGVPVGTVKSVTGWGRSHRTPVPLVTTARPPHSVELSHRFRRYVFSMAVRTAAVVLAIFVFHGWMRLVAIVAGVALPWLAVVAANAGPSRDEQEPLFLRPGEGGRAAGSEEARQISPSTGRHDDADRGSPTNAHLPEATTNRMDNDR